MINKKALQLFIYAVVFIPLILGGKNLIFGAANFLDASLITPSLDSQFRFMSGWYVGLAGLAIWIAPRVEYETTVFRILCIAVFIGGLGRALSAYQYGWPETRMIAGMALELAFPLLMIWQAKVKKTLNV